MSQRRIYTASRRLYFRLVFLSYLIARGVITSARLLEPRYRESHGSLISFFFFYIRVGVLGKTVQN